MLTRAEPVSPPAVWNVAIEGNCTPVVLLDVIDVNIVESDVVNDWVDEISPASMNDELILEDAGSVL